MYGQDSNPARIVRPGLQVSTGLLNLMMNDGKYSLSLRVVLKARVRCEEVSFFVFFLQDAFQTTIGFTPLKTAK